MLTSGFIEKGGIFMTVTLLVVGACGVKVTSENQRSRPRQINHTAPGDVTASPSPAISPPQGGLLQYESDVTAQNAF